MLDVSDLRGLRVDLNPKPHESLRNIPQAQKQFGLHQIVE